MTQAKYNLSRFACLSDKENLDRCRPSGCPVNCVLFVILTTLAVNQAMKSMNLTMKRMKPKLHTNLGTFLPTEMNGSSILVMGFKRVSVAIASYSGRGCS